MVKSAEQRSKFATLHRQWWRLLMSWKFSSGTKNTKTNKQTNRQILLHSDTCNYIVCKYCSNCVLLWYIVCYYYNNCVAFWFIVCYYCNNCVAFWYIVCHYVNNCVAFWNIVFRFMAPWYKSPCTCTYFKKTIRTVYLSIGYS